MTEETSTSVDLSVATTTTGMTQITAEDDAMVSSSSYGIQFYFMSAVVIIGVVGTATNALIIYALVASKQHKKHVLIVNQNALDLFASSFLTINYSIKLCNIYLTGSSGYWLCVLILSGSLQYCGLIGSEINLAIVSVERYLKIVHRTWSKKYLRKWIIYSAAAFAWIASFIYNLAVVFPTTKVINGACYAYEVWKNPTDDVANFIFYFVLFYITMLLIFIFCYWRILMVIRHQASVMAAHSVSGGSSNAPSQSNRIQTSVVKTIVFVSGLYIVTWLPYYVFAFLNTLNPNSERFTSGYFASVFISYLYICINPFIYATKFDPVKTILLRMIQCKISEEAIDNVART